MKIKSVLMRSLTVGTAAAAAAVTLPAQAMAAPATVHYLCPVTTPEGNPLVLKYDRGFDVTAPAKVKPSATFTVALKGDPINPLPNINKKVWNLKMVYQLPQGASYVRHSLTGGSNLGASRQAVQVNGSRITLSATGPFKAGEDAFLPTLNVVLKAPSSSGALVTSVAGTSYDDPGFRWTSEDPADGTAHDLQCYPDPAAPVELSRTVVG
ncbi:hypothetical protein [Streptomyces chrestomyceticus]|uniref:hypothetical protein n=1 Tax=Streptomyces chrestomyceticus TaxID=68185 RepID=UPI0037ADE0BD